MPDDVALRVPAPDGEVEALRAALVRLHDDIELRWSLRERARRFARTAHDLNGSAQAYAAAIDITIARRFRRDGEWVDGAAAALAAAGQAVTLGEDLLTRWTSIRGAVTGNAVSGAR